MIVSYNERREEKIGNMRIAYDIKEKKKKIYFGNRLNLIRFELINILQE